MLPACCMRVPTALAAASEGSERELHPPHPGPRGNASHECPVATRRRASPGVTAAAASGRSDFFTVQRSHLAHPR